MSRLLNVSCSRCGKEILRSTSRINESKKLGSSSYCSRFCQNQQQLKRTRFLCANEECHKEFLRSPSATSPTNYCSRSCATGTNNKKFPKRVAPIKICANATCGIQFRGETLHCSYACWAIIRQRHTKEQLIQEIQFAAKEMMRIPAKREMKGIAEACIHAFGTWNKAVAAAGLVPNRSHDDRMYKRSNTKARDGHICDSISEAIVDNWLTKSGVAHMRDASYPGTHHKADWAINGGSVFIEYFGLAKDSPRYDRAVKEKQALCEKHDIELIEIYPEDVYPRVELDRKLKQFTHAQLSMLSR